MQFNRPTYQFPATVPEREYPAGVIVDNQLRVWAMSRWRDATDFARGFLRAGYRHLELPAGAPPMFQIDQARPGGTGILVRFTNPYDAYRLLGQVFFCGCEFIAFTAYNIFTNLDDTFPTPGHMHTLPYNYAHPEDE